MTAEKKLRKSPYGYGSNPGGIIRYVIVVGNVSGLVRPDALSMLSGVRKGRRILRW